MYFKLLKTSEVVVECVKLKYLRTDPISLLVTFQVLKLHSLVYYISFR